MPTKWFQDRTNGSKTAPGMPPLRAFCGHQVPRHAGRGLIRLEPRPSVTLKVGTPLPSDKTVKAIRKTVKAIFKTVKAIFKTVKAKFWGQGPYEPASEPARGEGSDPPGATPIGPAQGGDAIRQSRLY